MPHRLRGNRSGGPAWGCSSGSADCPSPRLARLARKGTAAVRTCLQMIKCDSGTADGASGPSETVVRNATHHVKRQIARGPDDEQKQGVVARAKQKARNRAADAIASVKQKARDTIAAVRDPGKMQRVKAWAIDRLPYHPQFLLKGTVYDAELQVSLTFGTARPRPAAPQGTTPAPSSILSARLATT